MQTSAEKLKGVEPQTRLITVGVGLADPKELYSIASAPVSRNVILVPTINNLKDKEVQLTNVMCNGLYYLLIAV